MTRIDGTDRWSATFRMTSSDHGAWRVTCVFAYSSDGEELYINPSREGSTPTLEVIGSNAST